MILLTGIKTAINQQIYTYNTVTFCQARKRLRRSVCDAGFRFRFRHRRYTKGIAGGRYNSFDLIGNEQFPIKQNKSRAYFTGLKTENEIRSAVFDVLFC